MALTDLKLRAAQPAAKLYHLSSVICNAGHAPDKTYTDPGKADSMASDTYRALLQAGGQIGTPPLGSLVDLPSLKSKYHE